MDDNHSLIQIQKEWHGTLKSYLIGFISSLLLTALSFSLVAFRFFTGEGLRFTIIGLGILQALAQVLFFLHVGKESKPRWETLVFLFMTMVVVIIVIGTLWIMFDLNHRMMPKTM
jgi:cytochrome o ubiquinol oxidase operon protein cyoD